jgi:RNA polymerase sigma-70 factor (ECF subfamily)
MTAAASHGAVVVPLHRSESGGPWQPAGEDVMQDEDGELLQEEEADAQASLSEAAPTGAVSLDDAALAALIERIVDHDERALEALYDATAGRVHGLVLRITQRRALADEALEDTFWQVWRQAPRFDAARR